MSSLIAQPLESYLARITYGFTNPMPTAETGPFMVTAKDINHGRILYESARRTTQEAYDSELTDKSRPRYGDLLMTKDGTLGRMAIVDREDICVNQSVAVLRPSDKIRPRYLRFLLQEPRNFARVLGDADGSTIKHIYITRLAKMEVMVPLLARQDEILDVLAPLDDKIELNRQVNQTLEGMAREIFKDWFVDFGPTRRKAAGVADPVAILGKLLPDPAKAASIADLFPTTFGDNGLPEGWETTPLDSFGEIITGKTPSTKNPKNFGNDVAFLKIPDMHGNIYVLETATSLSIEGANSQKNKTLPVGSISVSCIASPGIVVLNHRVIQTNQQINSIIPIKPNFANFIFWSCRNIASSVMTGGSGGSVFPNMNKSTFSKLETILPQSDLLAVFSAVVDPFHKMILSNARQNQTLAETRDFLLPKLISGKISPGDLAL